MDLVAIRQDGMAGWRRFNILAVWNYRITRRKLHMERWMDGWISVQLKSSSTSIATVPGNGARKLVGTP